MTCDSPGCHLWEQLAGVGGALPTSLSSAPDPAWRDGVQDPQQGLRPSEEGADTHPLTHRFILCQVPCQPADIVGPLPSVGGMSASPAEG